MRILGIDFGLKTIGLALSDGSLAEPAGQIKFVDQEKLLTVIKDYLPELVILGLPEGGLAGEVENLGRAIEKDLKIRVDYQDETLSTVEAKQKLIEAGKPQKKRRQDHAAAAAVILQAYLDDRPWS